MLNSRTSLSPTNREVLHQLEEYADAMDDDAILTHEIALECLTSDEVDGEIRIPPRPYDK